MTYGMNTQIGPAAHEFLYETPVHSARPRHTSIQEARNEALRAARLPQHLDR